MFAIFNHFNFINILATLVSLIFTSEMAWIFTFMICEPLSALKEVIELLGNICP